MFLSPYQSIFSNGLNPHLCKAGFQHVALTPSFLSSSPLSFRLNMSETKCIIHLSISLLTSLYFYTWHHPCPGHPKFRDIHSLVIQLFQYLLCDKHCTRHGKCKHASDTVLGFKNQGMETLWWKSPASVNRAQRRECPKCLVGAMSKGCMEHVMLDGMVEVRRFSKRG